MEPPKFQKFFSGVSLFFSCTVRSRKTSLGKGIEAITARKNACPTGCPETCGVFVGNAALGVPA